jgi:thiamine biosynthesis lipoprotein
VWKYRENQKPALVTLSGTTMGPITYTVKYLSKTGDNYQPQIDSVLEGFNQSLNHYRPNSEVSLFNQDSEFVFASPYFYPVLEKSQEVFEATDGAFDPTVSPLVNAWGFGPEKREHPDSARIDSLRRVVYFHNIEFNKEKVWKKKKGIKLDFSAIAKGQGVDVIVEYLQSKGLENIFVEIGGEVRCEGKNENNENWRIGIVNPANLEPEAMYGTIQLENESMATSGNYYNYIEENGQRIVHTINPKTGYPVISNLLSASIVARDCMSADAYATACMVMGLEKSEKLLVEDENLDGILIYSNPDGSISEFVSEGLQKKFQRMPKPKSAQ